MSQVVQEIALARDIGNNLATLRRAFLDHQPPSVHNQLLKLEVAVMMAPNRVELVSRFKIWIDVAVKFATPRNNFKGTVSND